MNIMQQKVKAGYNQIAKKYDEFRNQFSSDKYLAQLEHQLNPNSTILDIGCGSGRPVCKYFADHGHQVFGIDISEEQIKLANKYVPNGLFEVKDMSQLKDAEYQVDAVVSFYAIFHTPREQHLEIFQKINSFLPAGGFLLVTMGATDWEGSEDLLGAEMIWSHYDPEKNAKIVEKAGFEILTNEIDSAGGEQHQVILAKKQSSNE